jgi:hypothetical protein
MGRLVRIPQRASMPTDSAGADMRTPRAGGQTATGAPAFRMVVEPDDYLSRLAKYVPAEVLAFSVFINAILDQALRAGGPTAMMAGIPVMAVAVAALIAGMIMAPFFVWYVHEDNDAWITNAGVSFVAFPFWSYALGAVAFTDIRDGNLAAILLATFTVASGLIKPTTVELPLAEEAHGADDNDEGEVIVETPPVRPAVPAGAPTGPRLVDLTTAINMPGP